jgi:hypothetical protein
MQRPLSVLGRRADKADMEGRRLGPSADTSHVKAPHRQCDLDCNADFAPCRGGATRPDGAADSKCQDHDAEVAYARGCASVTEHQLHSSAPFDSLHTNRSTCDFSSAHARFFTPTEQGIQCTSAMLLCIRFILRHFFGILLILLAVSPVRAGTLFVSCVFRPPRAGAASAQALRIVRSQCCFAVSNWQGN